ncbi:hypothetical protein Trydic_g11860 [Trypoxylus dichotomus]
MSHLRETRTLMSFGAIKMTIGGRRTGTLPWRTDHADDLSGPPGTLSNGMDNRLGKLTLEKKRQIVYLPFL